MKLTPNTNVHDLLDKYPFLLDFLAGYNPKFSVLKSKAMRETMGRIATLSMAATMGGIPVEKLIEDIAREISGTAGEEIETGYSPEVTHERKNLDELKDIIKDLHKGVGFTTVKKRFDQLMKQIDPTQIASMEEELIREGMPAAEIQRLCDLHVTVFKDALETDKPLDVPPGHPVHTYLAENTAFTEIVGELDSLDTKLSGAPDENTLKQMKPDFEEVLSKLSQIELHYRRKENQLFPFLEKHGITGPSQVMWGIHDEIREYLKELHRAIEQNDAAQVIETGPKFSRGVIEMIYKENTILYPMAMDTLNEEEWKEIRAGEDRLGYAFVAPGEEWVYSAAPEHLHEVTAPDSTGIPGLLQLDTGEVSVEQLNLLLTHLPAEITFVNEHDEVRYYSQIKKMVFPRSPGIIGRKVQNCHPPKSVDTVNRLIDAFRTGKQDSAVFWIERGGKFILIRYFAVRDKEGTYRGTVEVTEDMTAIRGLAGERKLVDWEAENKKSEEW